MNRSIFLYSDRVGQTFLTSMFIGKCHGNNTVLESPIWLRTIPEKVCKFWIRSTTKDSIIDDLIRKRPTVDTQELYSWGVPSGLSNNFYNDKGLFRKNDNWHFIYLFRNPKNSIESICKFGGAEIAGGGREKVFRSLCNSSRKEIKSLKHILSDKRFLLVRFEDLIESPLEMVTNIFSFMDLHIDQEFYSNLIKEYIDNYIISPFGDSGKNSNKRWLSWTKEEKEYFDSIVGPELKSAGFLEY